MCRAQDERLSGRAANDRPGTEAGTRSWRILIRTTVSQGLAAGESGSSGEDSGDTGEFAGTGVGVVGSARSLDDGSPWLATCPASLGIKPMWGTEADNMPQTTSTTAAASFNLDRNMVLSTPSVSTRTAEGITSVAVDPAMIRVARRETVSIVAAETADRDDSTEIAPASATAGETTPRRIIRLRRCSRPRARPALDRSDRPTEFVCRFFVSASFQVAEDDRRTIPIGQLRELFVKDRGGIVRGFLGDESRRQPGALLS